MRWKSTVPDILVIHLTSSYIKSPLFKGISFSQGFLHSDNSEEDTKLNDELDRSSFQEGCGAWLDLMRHHPSQKVKRHVDPWSTILSDHLFTPKAGLEGWEVERAYFNLLRSVAKPVGNVSPSWNYEELWARARTTASEVKMKTMFTKLSSSSFPAQPSSSKHSTSGQSFRGKGDSHRNDNTKSDNPSHDPPQPPTSKFCFACGSRKHFSKDCHESKQENGKAICIVRNTRGAWALQNGSSFCYRFNGIVSGGCSDKDCTKGKHICSRCLASTHGARECPEA
jgi:hypothetical protein